jgi:hypothetical protein
MTKANVAGYGLRPPRLSGSRWRAGATRNSKLATSANQFALSAFSFQLLFPLLQPSKLQYSRYIRVSSSINLRVLMLRIF